MDLTPERTLLFSDDSDYRFLDSLRMSLSSPFTCELIMTVREFLEEESVDIDPNEPLSRNELWEKMIQQSCDHLKSLGLDVPQADVLQIIRAQEAGVAYTLEPKWIPAVLVESIQLTCDEISARDELLKLMLNGQTAEDREKALAEGWYDASYPHEMEIDFAQEDFDIARRAGEILLELVEGLNLDL
jgi:hypothetical protein